MVSCTTKLDCVNTYADAGMITLHQAALYTLAKGSIPLSHLAVLHDLLAKEFQS